MSTDPSSLDIAVSALAEGQPFTVHWRIRALDAVAPAGSESGVVGQRAHTQLASFSTRKVSLLLATLALVRRGRLDLDQRLVVTEELKAGVQAGIMKNIGPGVELSLQDHLRQMMITSDNICTQLVFEAIGQVTGDALQWVNNYGAWVGLESTIHREIFPRSADLDWHHSIESMTVTTAADQAHLLAQLGRGTHHDDAAAGLLLDPGLCRFAIALMHQIYTPLLGARTARLRFAEKNGRGLRSLSQVGLAVTTEDAPVAAVALFAENIPTELPDGTPGRLAAYDFFAGVGRAVEDWYLGPNHRAHPGGSPPVRADPHLRPGGYSVTTPDSSGAASLGAAYSVATRARGAAGRQQGSESTAPHALAGVGKLFAALALAERATREPSLMQAPVIITSTHRRHAGFGPLRTHTGTLRLALGDALGLVIGTSDPAASLAVRDALHQREVDLVVESAGLLSRLAQIETQLNQTSVTGLEVAEEAHGDLVVGETSPRDLVQLLTVLATAGGLLASGRPEEACGISAAAANRVLKWMSQVFEPAGLAYALPGYGPRKAPQWSVSGNPLRPPSSWSSARRAGWTSVLISRAANPAQGEAPVVCVAAHIPVGELAVSGSACTVSREFGELGLGAYRAAGG